MLVILFGLVLVQSLLVEGRRYTHRSWISRTLHLDKIQQEEKTINCQKIIKFG